MIHKLMPSAAFAVAATMIPAIGDVQPEQQMPLQRSIRRATPLAAPQSNTRVTAGDIDCLASAMWHEARGEPRRGQIAIAEVVLARTRNSFFPGNPCAVITQKHQFSFVRHGRIPPIPIAADRELLRKLARNVVAGTAQSGLSDAIFFRAKYVHPDWQSYPRVGSIGGHVFYGWPSAVVFERRI